MKKNYSFTFLITVAMLGLIIFVISGCATKQENSNSEIQSSETQSVSDKNVLYEDGENLKVEPVDFEISAKCYFLPGSSFGVFNYNEKYGLINSDGNVVIEPIYEMLSSPSEGYLIAEKNDGSFCVLNTEGQEVAVIEYNNGEIGINRMTVYSAETCNDGTGQFSDGLAFMNVTNGSDSDIKTICVNTKGQVVFESNIELRGKFVNGVAVGTEYFSNGINIVAVDKTGTELWRREAKNNQMNSAATDVKIKDDIVVYQSLETEMWGAVNINGNQILDCEYEELTYAGNGKIGFKKYGLWGYMDYNEKVIIEPQFSKAYDFRGGTALVCDNNGKNSFIDEKGNVLFSSDEQTISYFENGIIMLNASKLLDSHGNIAYETDISQNGMGGTANGLSYDGGEVFYEFLRAKGATNDKKTYNYFRISTE